MTNPLPDKSEGYGSNKVYAPHHPPTLRGPKKFMDKILTEHFKRMEIERSRFRHK